MAGYSAVHGPMYVRPSTVTLMKTKQKKAASAQMGARGFRFYGVVLAGNPTTSTHSRSPRLQIRLGPLACLDDVAELPVSPVPSYHLQRRADLHGMVRGRDAVPLVKG